MENSLYVGLSSQVAMEQKMSLDRQQRRQPEHARLSRPERGVSSEFVSDVPKMKEPTSPTFRITASIR